MRKQTLKEIIGFYLVDTGLETPGSLTPRGDLPNSLEIVFGLHSVGSWLLGSRKHWVGDHNRRFSDRPQGVAGSGAGYLQIKHQEEESVGLISVLQLY